MDLMVWIYLLIILRGYHHFSKKYSKEEINPLYRSSNDKDTMYEDLDYVAGKKKDI